MATLPLIVIVGPTASGKTGLAIKLANNLGGEVVSADSRAIYKGIDIGSAKPTLEEMSGVQHWGFDLVEPGERFTVADFQEYAHTKIAEIRSRGKLPILAGGTGLYVDAVLFDYRFPPQASGEERSKWENMSLEQLHQYCAENNIDLPQNHMNKRYVVNSILHNGYALKRRDKIIDDTIVVGITTERDVLRGRIRTRGEAMIERGVIDEARNLSKQYGWDNEAMKGNIYPLAKQYIQGDIGKDELVKQYATKDWRLTKRQLTWFKRNEYIKWLSVNDAHTYITHELTRLSNS